MTKGDVVRIHERLDDILDKITEQVEISSKQEEHLRNLNGTVVRHEKQFRDVYGKVETNTGSIKMAQGGILVVGVIATLISIAVLTKGLIW